MDFLSGETANPRMLKERLARRRAEKRRGSTWADELSQESGNPLAKDAQRHYDGAGKRHLKCDCKR
jgi:hypothetical protein